MGYAPFLPPACRLQRSQSCAGQDGLIGVAPPPKTVVQVSMPGAKIPTGERPLEIALEVQSNPPGAQLVAVDGFATAEAKPAVEPRFFVHDRGGAFFFVPSVETLKLWARV